ncbi:hypothetical protein [Georgenia sp. AZ-5]|uniref:hypothetical protein n=1 Tax=Georgenia sp. AZ-5 TaxID=3367526 RepID=UPI003754C87E
MTQTQPPQAATRNRALGLAVRGAVGGIVAGIVFGAVNMWYAASTGMPAEMPLQMIATIVQGEESLAAGTASAPLGLVVHMVLSMAFGVTLALLVLRLPSDAMRAMVGLVFGVALYLVNFLVISPLAFPVFQEANQPLELATHVIYGAVAVLFLLHWRPTRSH